jgi:FKBP-type peptidyl-prolyl cis-trans isomerase
MMKVGGQAAIVCPAEIAYGDRGTGRIKPGAALRFEVELISIESSPPAGALGAAASGPVD